MFLAPVCSRVGVPDTEARRALVSAYPWPEDGPWASVVSVGNNKFAVGQSSDPTVFYCLPFPFVGNHDLHLPPFDKAEDFLVLIGGPRQSDVESYHQ
jgi:hypothetical protein